MEVSQASLYNIDILAGKRDPVHANFHYENFYSVTRYALTLGLPILFRKRAEYTGPKTAERKKKKAGISDVPNDLLGHLVL